MTTEAPYGTAPAAPTPAKPAGPLDPYGRAKAATSAGTLRFGPDGKLYEETGSKPRERSDELGTHTEYDPVYEAIEGWTFDTSTLPQPTQPSMMPFTSGGGKGPGMYGARLIPDNGGHLIEVSEGRDVVGWARQKTQREIMPDVTSARNRGVLGSDPRLANSGPDVRTANPGQNR